MSEIDRTTAARDNSIPEIAKCADFWRVYNYIAKTWYEVDRDLAHEWYLRPMVFLECLSHGWTVDQALHYVSR